MTKAQPKISTAIRIKPDLLKKFKAVAAQTGVSFTFLLNLQIQRVVDSHERKATRKTKGASKDERE